MTQTRQTKKMTPQLVAELLKLHKEGLSSVKLGKKFGIDHSTVLYHIKKVKLELPEVVTNTSDELPSSDTERINPGKNYAGYLSELAMRSKKLSTFR